MSESESNSLPVLCHARLERALLSGKFIVRGVCPACNQSLKLIDSEIAQDYDSCPSCNSLFSIPEAMVQKQRSVLRSAESRQANREAVARDAKLAADSKEAKRAADALKAKSEADSREAKRQEEFERVRAAEAEQARRRKAWELRIIQMKVTTGDLNEPYEIIGPVYFSVSNKGLFFNQLADLIGKYHQKLADMKSGGTITGAAMDWGFLYGEFSVGQSQFDSAFFIAVEELKQRAARVGGDAIVHMRQDIDIDTNGMQYFYLQMYGTAVKVKQPRAAGAEQA
jgi:uncharacterized protein YbjQ (UPF0145 family)